jgi:hypothetical protein
MAFMVICTPETRADPVPKDMEATLDEYGKKRSAGLIKLNTIYIDRLNVLKRDYMTKNNLNVAVLLQNQIDKLEAEVISLQRNKEEGEIPNNPPAKNNRLPASDEQLLEFLKDTVWLLPDKRKVTLHAEGFIIKSWGRLRPSWSVRDMKLNYEGKAYEFSDNFKEKYCGDYRLQMVVK